MFNQINMCILDFILKCLAACLPASLFVKCQVRRA